MWGWGMLLDPVPWACGDRVTQLVVPKTSLWIFKALKSFKQDEICIINAIAPINILLPSWDAGVTCAMGLLP